MITVKNLTKSYRIYNQVKDRLKESLSLSGKKYHIDFYALKDVTFKIEKKEVIGIIGNNGSGKSTLLKLLTGVLTPSSGFISNGDKITALLELGAGFNPEMTGIENIYLHGSLAGFSNEQMKDKVEEITSFAEIGIFMNQPIKTYSSGMKSRLSFALAISVEPKILIIDEVLSVGDAAFQRKCFAKIESFKKEGVTILFVSHSINHILELCSRVIWLDHGQKVIEGDTKIITSLYQKYGSSTNLDFNKVRDEFKKNFSLQKKSKKIATELIDPTVVSKSLVSYEEQGAKLSDIKVLDMNFNEVNILAKDEFYYYSYNLIVFDSYDAINLAMHLKTKTGLPIAGKEILIKKDEIEQNKIYNLKWKFKNILNQGVYFFNCGVNTIIHGEKVILHRVIDAYMVRVNYDKDDKSTAIVDFKFELGIE